MPVLKNAKKKLRQDKVRATRNKKLKDLFKKLVKEARAKKTQKTVSEAFSAIDKATKHFILHKNTAARMKSSLSKVIAGGAAKAAPVVKEVAKKVEKAAEKVEKKAEKVQKAATKATKAAKKASPKKK